MLRTLAGWLAQGYGADTSERLSFHGGLSQHSEVIIPQSQADPNIRIQCRHSESATLEQSKP